MPNVRNPSALRKFWGFEEGAPGEPSVLRLDGVIASESWFDDEVTPAAFRAELDAHPGDIMVYINSPGGDVIAGSQIYTMLTEHKGTVLVKIEGIAASAASVIAMAGDQVLMAPTAYMMIHNAWSMEAGNKSDLRHAADVLEEIDRGIRETYRLRTGLSERKIAEMMDEETWMSARTAIALGFADGYILGHDAAEEKPDEEAPEAPTEENREADIAARMMKYRLLPSVAWSPRRQAVALARKMGEARTPQEDAWKYEDALDEVDALARLRRQLKMA